MAHHQFQPTKQQPNAWWNPRYLKAKHLTPQHPPLPQPHALAQTTRVRRRTLHGHRSSSPSSLAARPSPIGASPLGARGTPAGTHAARPRAPSLAGGDGTGEPLRGCVRAATASPIPGVLRGRGCARAATASPVPGVLRACARAATASPIPGVRKSSSGPSPATSTLKVCVCHPLLFRP